MTEEEEWEAHEEISRMRRRKLTDDEITTVAEMLEWPDDVAKAFVEIFDDLDL
jgi:hypothetical protein